MKTNIKKSDFSFTFTGHGHYKVFYQSPTTGKTWWKLVTDMELIDKVKNESEPKKVDMNRLKVLVKF